MKRRAAIIAGAAAVGAAGGVGTALWRGRHASNAADEEASAAPIDLWAASFQTAEGKTVAMQSFRGRPLLLNFWATWCAPCVVEMPLLDAFRRERAGTDDAWQLLALAVDEVEPVRRFTAARSLTLPIALAGADGLDLSRQLGNSAGALPFTVVFDSAGEPVQRRLGAVNEALLRSWATTTR